MFGGGGQVAADRAELAGAGEGARAAPLVRCPQQHARSTSWCPVTLTMTSGRSGLAARLLPPRPRPGRRLIQPLASRRLRGIPRRLPQPRLQFSDPIPRLRQLPERTSQRNLRLSQLSAQRGHQGRQHLIAGTGIISRYSRTLLPPRAAYAPIPHHRSACPLTKPAGRVRPGGTPRRR